MGMVICLTDQSPGATDTYQCTCCGFTSGEREDFFAGACWSCAFTANAACATCVSTGVLISGYGERSDGHAHVLTDSTTTVCGLTFRPHETTGPGDLPTVCPTCALDPRARA